MILYLDSSAIVKLFVDEPGSSDVRSSIEQAADYYTHLIANTEVRAALAKAVRMGRATAPQLAVHKRELNTLWRALSILTPDEAMIARAGDLAERFALRAYDSVHLAAAETIRSRLDPALELRFAAFDTGLLGAATKLGFALLADG